MNVYIDNTNLIGLYRLKSVVDDAFIDDAEVEVTVVDADGNPIEGQDWPLSMEPSDNSPQNGDYIGVLSDDLKFEPGTTYYALVDVNAGQDRIGHWEVPFVARVRQ